jgi:hypothetical protein
VKDTTSRTPGEPGEGGKAGADARRDHQRGSPAVRGQVADQPDLADGTNSARTPIVSFFTPSLVHAITAELTEHTENGTHLDGPRRRTS